jgi:hypothetical protein
MASTSLLVDFDKTTGWRIRGVATYEDCIKIVHVEGKKLMHIPSVSHIQRGRFCNPRKLVFEHLYAKRAFFQTA